MAKVLEFIHAMDETKEDGTTLIGTKPFRIVIEIAKNGKVLTPKEDRIEEL